MTRASTSRPQRRGVLPTAARRREVATLAPWPKVMRMTLEDFQRQTGLKSAECLGCDCAIAGQVTLTTEPTGVWCSNCEPKETSK